MITRLARQSYVGLSTDTKPLTDIFSGAQFTESDTGKIYTWTGSAWAEMPLDHKNIAPGNIHVAYDFSFPDAATRLAYAYVPADIGKFIRQTDTDDIYMLTVDSPVTMVKVSGSGTGEPNTASNVGTGGIGLFDAKVGVDLQFKNVYAANGIAAVDNLSDKRVEISVSPDVTSLGDIAPLNVTVNGAGLDINDLNGDHAQIDYVPVGYARDSSVPEAGSATDLSAHLAGISNRMVQLGSGFVDDGNRPPVRLATAAALPAYTPLGSGIGKKLQANANGALSIDGIGVVAGNRVLIKNEVGAAAIHNGIYNVLNPGDGSNKYVLERAADYDEDGDIYAGHLVQSSEGSVNADEIWILTSDDPIVIESSFLYYSSIKAGLTASVVVAPAANTTVDSILLSQYHTAKWIVDIEDAVAVERESSEVLARECNLNTDFVQTNIIGDTLSYVISFTSNGVSMSFDIQNTGSNPITVRLRKLEV